MTLQALRVLLLLPLAILAGAPGAGPRAQEAAEYAVESAELAPGARFLTYRYFRKGYQQKIHALEIRYAALANLELLAAPGAGLWDGAPLQEIIEREGALAGWQAWERARGGEPAPWPGLAVARGALLAAPGEGPALLVTPEGCVELAETGGGAAGATKSLARIMDSSGLDLPIAWINRPGAAAEGFGLLANSAVSGGVFTGRIPGAAACARMEFQPQALFPPPSDEPRLQIPAAPWAFAAFGAFTWTSEPAQALQGAPPRETGWSGVVAAGESAAKTLLAQMPSRRAGHMRIETSPPWQDYETILPLRRSLIRAGKVTLPGWPSADSLPDPRRRAARSAIALDPHQGLLWLVHVREEDRQADGMTPEELVDFLLALGATEAAEGPEGAAADLRMAGAESAGFQRAAEPCRLALLLRKKGAAPDGAARAAGGWRITLPASAFGSAPVHWRNGPEKTSDRREGRLATLDHFWASEGDAGAAPWIIHDFQSDLWIARLDLVYAGNAGFSSALNPLELSISFQDPRNGVWRAPRQILNEEQRSRQILLFDPPERARAVRLDFLRPASLEAERAARLVEAIYWTRPARGK